MMRMVVVMVEVVMGVRRGMVRMRMRARARTRMGVTRVLTRRVPVAARARTSEAVQGATPDEWRVRHRAQIERVVGQDRRQVRRRLVEGRTRGRRMELESRRVRQTRHRHVRGRVVSMGGRVARATVRVTTAHRAGVCHRCLVRRRRRRRGGRERVQIRYGRTERG